MKTINRAITATCATAAVLAAVTTANAEPGTHGTLNWESGSVTLTRVECGQHEDHFILRGFGDGVRLRLSLQTDADELTATSVSLRFDNEHEHARAHFQMFASIGGIGPVLATRNEAVGQSHLRAANAQALDFSADGLTVDFTATCTHPLT